MSVSSWNDAPPRPPAEVLAWSRALLDPALRAAIDELLDATRDIAEFHFGWRDAEGRPAAGDAGKAVRPALALLSAAAVGGTAAAALPAAVAVELAHNFSLLHDDVMDGDATRRHRPTAWTVFGANAAILAGDALLAAPSNLAGGPPRRRPSGPSAAPSSNWSRGRARTCRSSGARRCRSPNAWRWRAARRAR
ncbi:polyprenyl synthetase family protein [Actinomadura sp. CNU-125]|uniref:polyprenyl synthetase family protein n=1 Tax=Actinomadura sp. CNU-125 TaxID=1904961 RepID=UPI000B2C6AB0|nr:polyprenyl synthetase family protein [Actinomadura sp. CNU-125]